MKTTWAMAPYKKKRNTQLHKKRKLPSGKKTQRGKLLPKRKQLLKRKSQGKKRVTKEVLNKKTVAKKTARKKVETRRRGLKGPYNEFVGKVLRQLHKEKVPISTKAKGKIISFIRCLYNSVSKNVARGRKSKANRTIGSLELQSALKRVMRKKPAMELVRAIRNTSKQN